MTRRGRALTALAVGVIVTAAIVRGAAARPYTIDAGRSSATIEVGKSGAFSFAAGHTHEVVASKLAGTIAVDVDDPAHSSVRVTIDASALKVSGKGESAADVPKVQETMVGPQVLDVQQYPTMAFASTNVALKAHTGATLDVAVTGQLTIRGTAREITVPVNVRMDGGTLTATGRFPVKQTDYGMKPVSVGGVVSVKDVVNISFTIVGK
ncbi:MAG TPA: YceI family protein [Vicinamibacterales bacterium]|jgi:polyisoprenoid-binding protein YceI